MENGIPKIEKVPIAKDVESLKSALLFLVNEIDTNNLVSYSDDVYLFCENLKARYPDYNKNLFYHALIGSTMPEGAEKEEIDFPGQDSVLGFVNNLVEKYRKK